MSDGSSAKVFYLTTPIYYVNDVPHIGHAYTTLACDALARWQRLSGQEVFFLTGTDEHGQKVQQSAEKAGVAPQALCDRVSQRFRDLVQAMNYSPDYFIRTTHPLHKRVVREFWQRIAERQSPAGQPNIHLGGYSGWYAVRDEAFYAESELTQSPDGQRLAPTGAPVEWREEPSYFFRLSDYQQPLLDFYAANPSFVYPASRYNEVKRFVEGGLTDLSISRTSFDWGIPVPGDAAHVMYVWLDALANYLTGAVLKQAVMERGLSAGDELEALALELSTAPDDVKLLERIDRVWPADIHMVGKDILRFHAVYWPAFLMAADLPCPKKVVAHGWWTNEGQKISKSLGNVIDPFELAESYGVDNLRYFLLREVPFGNDGDFSRLSLIRRCNAELANNLGNLAQRSLSMIAKNCEGAVPAPQAALDIASSTGRYAAHAKLCPTLLGDAKGQGPYPQFSEALQTICAISNQGNEFMNDQAPWALKKTDPARMEAALYEVIETVRCAALYLQPFVPEAAAKLLDLLAIPADSRALAQADAAHALKPGTALPAPVGAFPRLDEPAEAA